MCTRVKPQDGGLEPRTHHLTFISTVLALRGNHVYPQPLVDPVSKSVLCWNGEAWKIAGERVSGNDTELIFDLFLRAVSGDREAVAHRLAEAVASISGPFAFIFYDAVHSKLFFSRDCLGRRSLLQGYDKNGGLKLCSLCDGTSSTSFEEVGFSGIYMIDLEASLNASTQQYNIETLPWSSDPTLPAGHVVSR